MSVIHIKATTSVEDNFPVSSEVKKGVGTLPNPLPVEQRNETENSLQFGRSGSGVADNKLPTDSQQSGVDMHIIPTRGGEGVPCNSGLSADTIITRTSNGKPISLGFEKGSGEMKTIKINHKGG